MVRLEELIGPSINPLSDTNDFMYFDSPTPDDQDSGSTGSDEKQDQTITGFDNFPLPDPQVTRDIDRRINQPSSTPGPENPPQQ